MIILTSSSCDSKDGTEGRSAVNTTPRTTLEALHSHSWGWPLSRATGHGSGGDRSDDLCGSLLENTSLFSPFDTKH